MKNIPTIIHVVAAALIAPDGRVLVQKRAMHRHHGGLWEFPGGKLEAGEGRRTALSRELYEELSVGVGEEDLIYLASASIAGESHVIDLYTCRRWQGHPVSFDDEAIAWVAAEQLAKLAMPPLDVPLARRLAETLATSRGS